MHSKKVYVKIYSFIFNFFRFLFFLNTWNVYYFAIWPFLILASLEANFIFLTPLLFQLASLINKHVYIACLCQSSMIPFTLFCFNFKPKKIKNLDSKLFCFKLMYYRRSKFRLKSVSVHPKVFLCGSEQKINRKLSIGNLDCEINL